MTLMRYLRDRWQRWRERRDPRVLVRRLYAEGVIDDEMLLAARGQHPSQLKPYIRPTSIVDGFIYGVAVDGQLLVYAENGKPIAHDDWLKHRWIEVTHYGSPLRTLEWIKAQP